MLPRSFDRWPRWAWVVPLVAVAAYGVALAIFSEASLPTIDAAWQLWPYLSVQPVGEDAFYYLSTAWNLARGEGLTVHGHSSVTGIQPLFPILLAAPAKIVQWTGGSKWTFVRVVILLTTVIFCLLPCLFARLAERISARVGWRESLVVYVLTATSFSLFRLVTYGLETGLYLVLIVCSVMLSFELGDGSESGETTGWPAWAIGLVFGVTGLARIDFGVALGVFLAIGLVAGWFRLRDALASGATATAVVAPWLGYVYYHMGTIIPSSGIAETSYIPSERFSRRLLALAQSGMELVTPVFFVRLGNRVANIGGFVACVIVAIVIWVLRDDVHEFFEERAYAWFAAFGVLAIVYVALFRSVHFYHRYFSPLYLFVLPVFAVAIVTAADRYLESTELTAWLAPLVAVMLVQFFVWAGWTLHRDTAVTTQFLHADYNQALPARTISNKLPEDRGLLGAFQSGTIGYFHEDVINLDGKVNNEVIPYLAREDVCGYLREQRVEYVVGWFTFLEHHLEPCLREEWQLCEAEFPGPYMCIRSREW